MLDPMTAAATATKAYAMVKALVEAGREAHDVMGQVANFYGAASDVLYADKKVKNVSPFKRIVFSKSVEAEAVRLFALRKKIESQQSEIIQMINYAYGAQGLTEFRELRKQVAKEREEAVYRQIEMRENLLFSVGIFLCLGLISGIVILIFS
jgi:nitrogenase subunit NifH